MSGNISGGAIAKGLKLWLSTHPVIRGVLSNPLIISILMLIIIWLLDLLYGKNFECATLREIIQHFSTALFVMGAGIILNNLAISSSCKSELIQSELTQPDALHPVKKGKGVCGCESDKHIPSFGAGVTPEKYDSVISQYVE